MSWIDNNIIDFSAYLCAGKSIWNYYFVTNFKADLFNKSNRYTSRYGCRKMRLMNIKDVLPDCLRDPAFNFLLLAVLSHQFEGRHQSLA